MAQLIILIGRLVDLEWTFVGHIKRTAIGLPPILQIYHGHVLQSNPVFWNRLIIFGALPWPKR